jgi:hypothetical protein
MTTGGWMFLGLSWSVILGTCVFCFVRVLRPRPPAAKPGAEEPEP